MEDIVILLNKSIVYLHLRYYVLRLPLILK